nr:hypothetical protein [Tanacetum cinerariifolium]
SAVIAARVYYLIQFGRIYHRSFPKNSACFCLPVVRCPANAKCIACITAFSEAAAALCPKRQKLARLPEAA